MSTEITAVAKTDTRIDLLTRARQHLPLAAASWNEAEDRTAADFHVAAVLGLIKEIDTELAAPALAPVEEAGGNPSAPFDGYLCKAWGETELPCAEVVRDMAGVRRFIVREWLSDDNAPDLPKIMEEIEADLEREKAWFTQFEIGGASVEPVYSFGAPGAAAAPADIGMPEVGSNIVNDACWKFAEAMPHDLPGPIWNDLKPALYAALTHYHQAVLAVPPVGGTHG
ncbi:hypothetical protein GCM10007320_09110 [Pseudorhodoferax aquiterrae]|uniref:Uncharacterized protein n=1 Tax=Pseudorhodoferax aquiterrae TaxID=747304 RepID=A0ABQ3FX86_9BURK|nr:hypothetical protein [Pseudorhodoferax aquiterrae]GHC72901.1 hypothetical protein GCM10007320_09110 [Pseudorhodoferax aquiterrae]